MTAMKESEIEMLSKIKEDECKCEIILENTLLQNRDIRNLLFDFLKRIRSTSFSSKEKSEKMFLALLMRRKYIYCEYGMFLIEKCIWEGFNMLVDVEQPVKKRRSLGKLRNFFEDAKEIVFSHVSLEANSNTTMFVHSEGQYELNFKRIIYEPAYVIDDNLLINTKIKLYSFILPEHLEIETYSGIFLEKIQEKLLEMRNYRSPSAKMNILVKTFRIIVSLTDKEMNLETILPIFIYTIIKAKFTDILKHFELIKLFSRKILNNCKSYRYENSKKTGFNESGTIKETSICAHIMGNNLIEKCKCHVDLTYEKSIYLTTVFESAIFFIKIMEFDKLKITKEEFDARMSEKEIEF